MTRKTAIRKLMGYGMSRNEAARYLWDVKFYCIATNETVVALYKIAGNNWTEWIARHCAPVNQDVYYSMMEKFDPYL